MSEQVAVGIANVDFLRALLEAKRHAAAQPAGNGGNRGEVYDRRPVNPPEDRGVELGLQFLY